MNKARFAAVALAGAFFITTNASALQVGEIRRGTTMERQQELDDKRALRERIRAKHEEYRALRNANDPRAAQAEYELQTLKADWQRLYGSGNSGKRDGHMDVKQKDVKQKDVKQKRPKRR